MTDFSNVGATHSLTPKYRLFQQAATTAAAPTTQYNADQLALSNPAGGAAGTDPALLQQTEQLMSSPNVQDRYRAIVNLTKMNPQDALPRLQAMVGAPGQDPQVVQLGNEAIRVMSQMAQQPTQPVTNQPGVTPPVTNQPPVYQPLPTTPTAPIQYNPGVAAPTNAADAEFVLQTLQTDLSPGGDNAVAAIRQIAAIAQSQPQLKEAAYNMLLNHVYNKRDDSVTEALKALGAMNDPRLLPYLQMVQRNPGYTWQSQETAVALYKQLAAQGQPGVGTASVGGTTASPEYIRAMEYELGQGGPKAMAAFQEIQKALGADPRAQSPIRQEVIRVLVTHLSRVKDTGTQIAAAQLLGQMGAREMDALRYLDAVVRTPGYAWEVQAAAKASIQQILATPPIQ